MKKKIVTHVLSILGIALLLALLAPLDALITNPTLGIKAFALWHETSHWLISLLIAPLIYFAVYYFLEYRPRDFYYCFDIMLVSFVTLIAFFGLLTAFVFIAIAEALQSHISCIALLLPIFLLIIYVTWHRGLAIYKDKIRIFKFRIKTYPTTTVDNIIVEQGKFLSSIHITICGDTTTFRLSTISAKICEKRLKTVVTTKKELTP